MCIDVVGHVVNCVSRIFGQKVSSSLTGRLRARAHKAAVGILIGQAFILVGKAMRISCGSWGTFLID